MNLKKILATSAMLVFGPALADPLTVTNGKFTKDGKPFNGVGVNYFDAFTRYAENKYDTSWKDGLKTLNHYGIPFIRINTFGYWSEEIKTHYLNNKPQFYTRLDEFMNEADKQHVGVILNLFFNLSAFTELNSNDYSELANKDSRTRKMMRDITAEIVDRYKNHPALWGWEFANETNQLVDLPANLNNSQYLPRRDPEGKLQRTTRDNYGVSAIIPTMTEFAEIIRQRDMKTPVFTGNGASREYSYHVSQLNKWDQDTPEQFGFIVGRDNPGKVNTLTMHVYPEQEGHYFGSPANSSYSAIIAAVMARSKIDSKPFFLGEFGVNEKKADTYNIKTKFKEVTSAIMSNRVPLSALWVFDKPQEGEKEKFNVNTPERIYQLEAIQKMNKDMQSW
ncbi:hypothetical protein [Undibacterium sp. TJN19]|uniref:hypothetical protein n=1 Tax=Undibacterium sp. TJN19 TaxID=3413055 RepID=UPI003BF09C87